jgi:hypothetical protein
MGELDAIGDAAAGGILAGATEPSTGEGDGHTHERSCLNCGCALIGDYCHCCGQKAHIHRTLRAFGHDLLHGVLHFEGKIWRTLPLLAWRPGELTRRYVEGQRASFVSPLALFLFSIFLMFAVVSATGNLDPNIGASSDLASAEKEAQAGIAKMQKRRAAAPNGAAAEAIAEDIRDAERDLAVIRDLRRRGIAEASFSRSSGLRSDVPWLKDAVAKAKKNPELLLYKLKSNSYKWSWAIIPLSVPFLWLLFPFSRRFRLYDHVVFVTYSLSFMTLLVIIGTLLAAAGISQVAPVMMLLPPIHMYRQLKGAYGLGRFGAAWRAIFLTIAAILVLSTFIMGMVALGVMD